MKICIVTVYNSVNCGSYLQAMALKKALENQGHEVSFLKTGARKNTSVIKGSLVQILKGKVKKGYYILKSMNNFKKHSSFFKVCENIPSEINKQDFFILGSDEIWNISREKAFARFPIFWGGGIDSENIISYAPSVNNTTISQLKDYPYAEQGLRKIKHIGVRDRYTQSLVKELSDRDSTLVADPTMLLEVDYYKKISGKCPYNNFILIYSFGAYLSQDDINACKEYAKKTGKKLISFGTNHSWCDITVAADPYDFLAFFEKADTIFTDTFHGTIFSLLYNKKFVSFGGKNKKVAEVLSYFNLENRIAKNSFEVPNILMKKIDYIKVNERIAEIREESTDFIVKSLRKENIQ